MTQYLSVDAAPTTRAPERKREVSSGCGLAVEFRGGDHRGGRRRL
jgi:hypothetical protein